MEIDTSTWMLIFFVISLVASIWKIWAFLPNKALADDDKTEESQKELLRVMLKVIKEHQGKLDEKELFLQITEDESFDSKLFWRFNLNRLKQLLNAYYIENPKSTTIEEIYENLKA